MRRRSELDQLDDGSLQDIFGAELDVAGEEKDLVLMLSAIEKGADINHVVNEKSCSTRLHVAAGNGDLDKTKLLLEAGADPNKLDRYGRNALQCALSSPAIMKLLMEKKSAYLIKSDEVLLAKVGEKVSVTTMRLFSAAIKKGKKYPFTQTVIDLKELDEYLWVLAVAKGPIDEIVSIIDRDTPHWFCVQIQIDAKEVRLIIFDSLGHVSRSRGWDGYHAQLTEKIRDVFLGKSFVCYMDFDPRQMDDYSCSAFTMKDVGALNRARIPERPSYLREKYAGNLFNYCAKKGKYLDKQVYVTPYPLPMMKMVQSKTRLNSRLEKQQDEEVSSVRAYFDKHYKKPDLQDLNYVSVKGIRKEKDCQYNEAARRYLEKIWQKTMEYVAETPVDKINDDLNEFDLSGLKARLG